MLVVLTLHYATAQFDSLLKQSLKLFWLFIASELMVKL